MVLHIINKLVISDKTKQSVAILELLCLKIDAHEPKFKLKLSFIVYQTLVYYQ